MYRIGLLIGLVFGCNSDKIYLDTGFIRGGIADPDPGDPGPSVDSGDDDPDPEDRDADGDGYTPADGDCDDDDPAVNPEASESCNGLDDDCDGIVDDGLDQRPWYLDLDGDGWGDSDATMTACDAPSGYVAESGDCDDSRADVYQDAPELCDGADNDCDDQIDEDATTRFYRDLDGDGFGDPADVQDACEMPAGFVSEGTDCDDTEPSVNPIAEEICNAIDDDCDGAVDDVVGTTTWYLDADGDGYGDEAFSGDACASIPDGHVWVDGDCDDSDPLSNPDATERCDGVDNDCDGELDEDGTSVWYVDSDGDGAGDLSGTYIGCDAPEGYVATPYDCDDSDSDVLPGADERCNGIDDDCDAEVDESAVDASMWFRDQDSDGYGDRSSYISACDAPEGHVGDATDCDDDASEVHPDAPEVCNEVDDDCDTAIDVDDDDLTDGVASYIDEDGDGWGDETVRILSCDPDEDGWSSVAGDCDDTEPDVNPMGTEVCDGLDNDCDGLTDPGSMDSDGDGIANCVDETVYFEDFSSGDWEDWESWYISGNAPNWIMTGRYLTEESNAANAIAYSPYLGTLDEFTLSVDVMQNGGLNNGCGIAYAVEEGDEAILVEWLDPTNSYGWAGEVRVYEFRGSWISMVSTYTSSEHIYDYYEWATLSVTVDGRQIDVYLDDDLILSHTYSGSLLGPGRVGVWTYDNDGGVYFDNVAVTQSPM